jgi:hypothetical protein
VATDVGAATATAPLPDRASNDADHRERLFRWIALGAFVALGLALALSHEPWRDEIEAWLIARNSSSIGALIHNSRGEGHPLLWYLFLWAASRASRAIVVMQLLHLAIAAAAAACVLWRAPFRRWQRAALIFGYFPLYEYSAIARNYALGMLLLFLFCILAVRSPRPYIRLVVIVILMGSTSVYGLVVGAAVAAGVVIDEYVGWRWHHGRIEWRRAATALAVAVGGLALVVAQYIPALSSPGATGFTHVVREDRVRGAIAPFAGLLPIPNVETRFWGTNILDGLVDGTARVLIGLVLLALLAWCLRDRPAALGTWLLGTGVLVVLSLQGYQGYLRHAGHFFLLFVAICWMRASFARWPDGKRASAGSVTARAAPRVTASGVLSVLLVVQLAAAVVPVATDLTHEFSGSEAMADLLTRKGYGHAELVLWPEYEGIAVVGRLDRAGYLPALGRRARDQQYDSARRRVKDRDVLRRARAMCRREQRPVVLVTTTPWHDRDLTLVGKVTDTIVDSEQYFAYRVRCAA